VEPIDILVTRAVQNITTVKKSHIRYEMALTNVYKQVAALTLQAGFVRMS
jgi:hypothetical protein